MMGLIKAFLAAALSLAIGLAITERMLRNGGPFDVVKIGAWNIATRAGATDADPYTRASLERSGEIPLALGEGLQLIARDDDLGRALDPRCAYRLGPRAPSARYWTLELVDLDGFPVDNPANRNVFRSSEILREADGSFSIWVSATAHAGNWLPIGAAGAFSLVLRLYDSPISATSGGIEKTTAPTIAREGCA
jgi:hypothetical protein